MKGIKSLIIGTALSMITAACGGDEELVDPGFCGHGCVEDDPIDLPDGGEVRLEVVQAKGGEDHEVRTHAWFASEQTPDSRPWNRDPSLWQTSVEVSEEFPAGVCTDVSSKDLFPNGYPESRTYRDVGETVTLTNGEADLVLDQYAPFQDYVFFNVYDIGYYNDFNPDRVPLDAEYDVILGEGESAVALEDEQLFMPPLYDVDFPNMDVDTIPINRNEPLPIVWEDDAPDDDPFLYSFAAFGDALGVRYFCIAPKVGVMEIPSEVFHDIPSAGWMQHGLLSHRPVDVDGRRVDFFGVSCNEGEYTLTDASGQEDQPARWQESGDERGLRPDRSMEVR